MKTVLSSPFFFKLNANENTRKNGLNHGFRLILSSFQEAWVLIVMTSIKNKKESIRSKIVWAHEHKITLASMVAWISARNIQTPLILRDILENKWPSISYVSNQISIKTQGNNINNWPYFVICVRNILGTVVCQIGLLDQS